MDLALREDKQQPRHRNSRLSRTTPQTSYGSSLDLWLRKHKSLKPNRSQIRGVTGFILRPISAFVQLGESLTTRKQRQTGHQVKF
jgi:hypothetical protein